MIFSVIISKQTARFFLAIHIHLENKKEAIKGHDRNQKKWYDLSAISCAWNQNHTNSANASHNSSRVCANLLSQPTTYRTFDNKNVWSHVFCCNVFAMSENPSVPLLSDGLYCSCTLLRNNNTVCRTSLSVVFLSVIPVPSDTEIRDPTCASNSQP